MPNSVLFTPDAKPATDPIAEARLALRHRWESERAAQRAEIRAHAERMYEDYLAREREKWVKEFISDNEPESPTYPYSGLSESDAYRLSLDREIRLEQLIEAGMWSAAIQCWIYRRGCKASLSAVKDWLKQHDLPVDGDEAITTEITSHHQVIDTAHARVGDGSSRREVIHADGISSALKTLLRQAGLTVEHGQVLWVVRYRGRYSEIPVLACDPSQAEDYPPEEF